MKLKPHTDMLRPGVLFVFSLHLLDESLSLSSLPHPHHHQGLVVALVCQGALREEGKHRRVASGGERWPFLVLTYDEVESTGRGRD